MGAVFTSVAALLLAMTASAAVQVPAILTLAQLKSLEQQVAAHPEDSQLAESLGKEYAIGILGITGLTQYGTVTGTDPAKASGDMGAYASGALSRSQNAAVVGAAGKSLWFYSAGMGEKQGSRDLAASTINRAIQLAPSDAQLRAQRIQITRTRALYPQWQHLTSEAAYASAREDLAAMTGIARSNTLAPVAAMALAANRPDEASAIAMELLGSATDKKSWNYGDAVFHGNTILGQLALRRGDLAGAKEFLRKSAEVDGSPVLKSFGPNMSLANDLIAAGERESVLEFFAQCRTFWKMDHGQLDQWTAMVKGGGKPNFGGNLVY